MGRWRRKRNSSSYKQRRNDSSSWTWVERKLLLAFLGEYRDKALKVYQSSANRKNESLDVGIESRTIGAIDIPALTLTDLSQPYWAFPKSLSSKQRKMTHECCVEGMIVGLQLRIEAREKYIRLLMSPLSLLHTHSGRLPLQRRQEPQRSLYRHVYLRRWF